MLDELDDKGGESALEGDVAQRCSYCGRTEKQHNGMPCVDKDGFNSILVAERRRAAGELGIALANWIIDEYRFEDPDVFFAELIAKAQAVLDELEGK